MLKNILNLEGIQALDRDQQKTVNGGYAVLVPSKPCHPNGDFRQDCY